MAIMIYKLNVSIHFTACFCWFNTLPSQYQFYLRKNNLEIVYVDNRLRIVRNASLDIIYVLRMGK